MDTKAEMPIDRTERSSAEGTLPEPGEAQTHSRRAVIVAAGGVAAIGVAAALASRWRLGINNDPNENGEGSAMPADQPTPRSVPDDFGPPPPPPEVTVVGRGSTGAGDVLVSTATGTPASLTAQVVVPAWNRILEGTLVVAAPGSLSGAFNPASAPDRAAMRKENQLAASERLRDISEGSYEVTVTFEAVEPGTYPVFWLSRIIEAADRRQAAPAVDSGATVHNTSAELGAVIVK